MKPDQASKVSVPKFFNTLLAILVITLSSTSLAGSDAAKRFDKGLWIWKELVCDQQGNVSDTVLNGYKKAGINVLFLNCGLPYDDWEFLDRRLKQSFRSVAHASPGMVCDRHRRQEEDQPEPC